MKGNSVTILRPEKSALAFDYTPSTHTLLPKALNFQQEQTALAHVLWGCLAYDNEWYQSDQVTRFDLAVSHQNSLATPTFSSN